MGKVAKKFPHLALKKNSDSANKKHNNFKGPPTATGAHVKKDNKNKLLLTVPPGKDKKLKLKGTGNRVSKKDKIKLKKDKVLEKVELTKEAFKEDKAKKKREKTIITGDLRPLMDSLPSLESLYQMKSPHTRTGVPQFDSISKNEKKQASDQNRKSEFINRYNKYKQLLQMGKTRDNPRQMIADHIKRKKLQNQTDNSDIMM